MTIVASTHAYAHVGGRTSQLSTAANDPQSMTSGRCTTWLLARSGLCCCAAMLALTAALHLFWRSSSGREGSLRILQYRQPQVGALCLT